MPSLPKISCLLIVTNKWRFTYLLRSLQCYLDQSYPNRELLIVNEGPSEYQNQIQSHIDSLGRTDIRCVWLDGYYTLGALRNISMALCTGDIFCQWDDDDFCAPQRLSTQYSWLNKRNAKVCYLSDQLHYYFPTKELFWDNWAKYQSANYKQCSLVPGTIMAYRDVGVRYPSAGKFCSAGEDSVFRCSDSDKTITLSHCCPATATCTSIVIMAQIKSMGSIIILASPCSVQKPWNICWDIKSRFVILWDTFNNLIMESRSWAEKGWHLPMKISCVMVTRGNFDLIKKSIFCYLNQTYRNKELIILSQGEDNEMLKVYLKDLGRRDIPLMKCSPKMFLGAMRNLAIELTTGEMICQWDDDDLYHPRRIQTHLMAFGHGISASIYQQHLKYFADTKELYWIDWAGMPKNLNVISVGRSCSPSPVSMSQQSAVPRESSKDVSALHRLMRMGKIAPVFQGYQYIYV